MPWTAPEEIGLHLIATSHAVRDGLDRLLAEPLLADLSEDGRGTLWTVLAEVLNNIVEHAYAGTEGDIRLRLWRRDGALSFEVLDCGAPMPGLRLPDGKLAELGDFDDLPEGGFGWFLIRSMTNGLVYDRIGGENRLRFCMECH